MTGLHLVTGYKGTAHVTSADTGVLNAMMMGTDDYVLTNGKRFEASIINNNTVRIYDGSLVMNGRHVNLDSGAYLDATIGSGASGMKRHDIIVIRYTIDTATGIEAANLVVIPGTASAGTPTDPTITNTNSILTGASVHDMVLYRVILNNLVIEKVEPLFKILAPMAEYQHTFYKQNMLINGDFQCNQRGNKTYCEDGTTQYSVDMWRAFSTKVQVLNEGVKLTGLSTSSTNFFTQFIQLGKLKTTTYTISTMVDDVIYTFTETPGSSAKTKNCGKFTLRMLTSSTWDNKLADYNNKLKIDFCVNGTNSVTVKYINVFEGNVAFPHMKEDYATALSRCRRYIQANYFCSPINETIPQTSTTASTYNNNVFIICFDEMATTSYTPVILEKCVWAYVGKDRSAVSGTITNQVLESPSRGFLQTTSNTERYANSFTVYGDYVITTEPRDK